MVRNQGENLRRIMLYRFEVESSRLDSRESRNHPQQSEDFYGVRVQKIGPNNSSAQNRVPEPRSDFWPCEKLQNAMVRSKIGWIFVDFQAKLTCCAHFWSLDGRF